MGEVDSGRILMVSTDAAARRRLGLWLSLDEDVVLWEATSGEECLDVVDEDVEVVCIFSDLDDMEERDLLTVLHARHPEISVIVVSEDSEVDSVVDAMRRGAVDYIEWPCAKERMLASLRYAVRQTRKRRAGDDGEPYTPRPLTELERWAIEGTLEYADRNISRAADLLQIARSTLYRKMRSYDIQ